MDIKGILNFIYTQDSLSAIQHLIYSDLFLFSPSSFTGTGEWIHCQETNWIDLGHSVKQCFCWDSSIGLKKEFEITLKSIGCFCRHRRYTVIDYEVVYAGGNVHLWIHIILLLGWPAVKWGQGSCTINSCSEEGISASVLDMQVTCFPPAQRIFSNYSL